MARRRWRLIPLEVRREVMALAAQGRTYREILERVDISMGGISCVLRPLGGVIRREALRPRSGLRLSVTERHSIWWGLEAGESLRAIARRLHRDPSTVSREVAANGGRAGYQPHRAHTRAHQRGRRPKPMKLRSHPALWVRVEADLRRLWSPQQISARLRVDFGDDVGMNVSPETIYRTVYVQGRGELRRELARCLRTGRATRQIRGRLERRGALPDMVMISERPPEVEDRAVPGHWEGDLLMGAANRSAIGTLVERSTRFVMLLHLPKGRGAPEVRRAMAAKIATLPEALHRSITWDQGQEMSEHLGFSVGSGVQVYFCDPHSPWQRGSNENTNGLLRQYLPKGSDLSVHTEADLDAVADSLNGRPRQTLGWMTPSEKLAELGVAMTG
jgi:IS30 family transposase